MSKSNAEGTAMRAYMLWEAAGRPEGDSERFWFRAEQEMAEGDKPAKAPRAPSTKARKTEGGDASARPKPAAKARGGKGATEPKTAKPEMPESKR